MRQLKPLLLIVVIVLAALVWNRHADSPPAAPLAIGTADSQPVATHQRDTSSALPAFLPAEARTTLTRIAAGGPFEHRQDGSVFGNYEQLLPAQPRGYYHEYTVPTPGLGHRGARRIVTGGTPPQVWYYTDDHYRSFRRFEVAQ